MTGILWDVDPEDGLQEGLGLPSNAYVHTESEETIADALTESYGWCVSSMRGVEETSNVLVFAA